MRETTCLDCGIRFQVASKAGPTPRRCGPHAKRHYKAAARERDRLRHENRMLSRPTETPCADCSAPVPQQRNGRPLERCGTCRIKRAAEQRSESSSTWAKANPERMREQGRRRYWRNAEQIRAAKLEQHYLHKYGLSLDDLARLMAEQGGKCKICGNPPNPAYKRSTLHVDHCHRTGKVRGMLCSPCNTGLGLFKEDPKLMAAAAAYLASPT